MYRFDPNPNFWTPARVREPGSDEVQEFRACFKALTVDEFNEYELADPHGAGRFVEDTLQDADDVADKAGKKLAFSAELKASMIATPHVRAALIAAYIGAFQKAAQGN